MNFTRRDFGRIALAAFPAAQGLAAINSKINGVQIGAITYSFNTIANDPPSIIQAYIDIGLGEVELMSNHCEALAGAPAVGGFGGGGRGRGQGQGQVRGQAAPVAHRPLPPPRDSSRLRAPRLPRAMGKAADKAGAVDALRSLPNSKPSSKLARRNC